MFIFLNHCIYFRLVSVLSNKPYLSNGNQQDCEEFFTALFSELEKENPIHVSNSEILQTFVLKTKAVRKFLDTSDGHCGVCNQLPSEMEADSLMLQVDIPASTSSVNLSSLIESYFSVEKNNFVMKCSNCCKCEKNCTRTGKCEEKPAMIQHILTKTPSILMIQLKRFRHLCSWKNLTKVVPEETLTLSGDSKYRLQAVVQHLGTKVTNGHYTCYTKDGEVWNFCNDSSSETVDKEEVLKGSGDGYILFYSKTEENEAVKTTESQQETSESEFRSNQRIDTVNENASLLQMEENEAVETLVSHQEVLETELPTNQMVDLGTETQYSSEKASGNASLMYSSAMHSAVQSHENYSSSRWKCEIHKLVFSTRAEFRKHRNENNCLESCNEKERHIIKESQYIKEDGIIAQEFVGVVVFKSMVAYPDNDGYKWKSSNKKLKGKRMFQCVNKDCQARKFKVLDVKQYKFKWGNKSHRRSFSVNYEVPHSCGKPSILENASLTPLNHESVSASVPLDQETEELVDENRQLGFDHSLNVMEPYTTSNLQSELLKRPIRIKKPNTLYPGDQYEMSFCSEEEVTKANISGNETTIVDHEKDNDEPEKEPIRRVHFEQEENTVEGSGVSTKPKDVGIQDKNSTSEENDEDGLEQNYDEMYEEEMEMEQVDVDDQNKESNTIDSEGLFLSTALDQAMERTRGKNVREQEIDAREKDSEGEGADSSATVQRSKSLSQYEDNSVKDLNLLDQVISEVSARPRPFKEIDDIVIDLTTEELEELENIEEMMESEEFYFMEASVSGESALNQTPTSEFNTGAGSESLISSVSIPIDNHQNFEINLDSVNLDGIPVDECFINESFKRRLNQGSLVENSQKRQKIQDISSKGQNNCDKAQETKEVRILEINSVEQIDENVNMGTAFIIQNTQTKPKIDRSMFQWGPNQPGKNGLSSYKCKGLYFYCTSCNVQSENKNCEQCSNQNEELQCKAIKYMYVCSGKCKRKIWDNKCCGSSAEKLVVFYPVPHTCKMRAYEKVETESDILSNIKIFNKSQGNKYKIEVSEKLPNDITGNKIYLIPVDKNDGNIEKRIKDGRRYKKKVKTNNNVFNNIFGKDMEDKVCLYKCRGTMYCFNSECPFLKRFEAMNQVQFDQKNGKKCCVSCGEVMQSLNCDGKKYIAYDQHFIVVKHDGEHECPAQSIFETNIVQEIENYFALNGLSTPFEAVVNHLNQKLDLQNAGSAIQDIVKMSLKRWTLKNVKSKIKKRQNPYGPTIQAARMISNKLNENAKNPYDIEIQIVDDSFVCGKCSFVSVQNTPEEIVLKNCPSESCNHRPMERAGPYIYITSLEGLKTLRDLNQGGFLEKEALHIDFQPSRINQHTTLAGYCYDLDLRSMAPLFSAILTKETEMSVYVILELVKKSMREKLGVGFDPALYMADEATSLKNAVVREHGPGKLQSYGTCELHFMKSVFQHCTKELGSQQKQFEHLKFAESLMNAATPAIYDSLYEAYKKWINERPGRIECLGEFLNWWHARRCGWSKAFRNAELPRTNLAEVGNAKFSSRSGMTKLALDMGMKAIIAEHNQYSAKRKGVLNGDFLVGSGRSRLNLEEKQIKELFRRIEETPMDKIEESKIINEILVNILGSHRNTRQTNTELPDSNDIVLENISRMEKAFQDSPSNKGSTHRPPNRERITPKKNSAPKSGRVILNLQTNKESLQRTMTGSVQRQLFSANERAGYENKKPSKKNGNTILKRVLDTFKQLIYAEQTAVGKFRLVIQKPQGVITYETRIIGRHSCLCEDFKRKNRSNSLDKVICKHFIYCLLVLGIDPSTQRTLLEKSQSSYFTDEENVLIRDKCMDVWENGLYFSPTYADTIFKKLEGAVGGKRLKKTSDLDIRLRQQKPLPFINESRLYGNYSKKNEAMREILNKDRFTVKWYLVLAEDGRRTCPGEGSHDQKKIQRGQLCLAVDFNSVIVKNTEEAKTFKIKDQRRYFCLQKECIRSFSKRILTDFSNIEPPKRVNCDYITRGSSEELQFLDAYPELEVEQSTED